MGKSRTRAAMGVLGAAGISAAAHRAHALSPAGAVAATIVGGAVVAGAGMRGGAALAAFFLSSTLLGRLPGARAIEQHRGNERDAVQVTANGGVVAVLALAAATAPERAHALLEAGIGGAVAAATADTWATEIGSRSRQRPRSIVTARPVTPGTSGGVTMAGLAASAVGTALIAGVFSVDPRRTTGHWPVAAVAIALGGFSGALADSVLGATVQEVRYCDACARESEQKIHRCGTRTRPIRGATWCTNDTVNALATLIGATTAMIARHAGRDPGRMLELGTTTSSP